MHLYYCDGKNKLENFAKNDFIIKIYIYASNLIKLLYGKVMFGSWVINYSV